MSTLFRRRPHGGIPLWGAGASLLLLLAPAGPHATGRASLEPTDEIVFREGLTIAAAGRSGRSALHLDAIEAVITAGSWKAPRAGDTIALPWLPAGQ